MAIKQTITAQIKADTRGFNAGMKDVEGGLGKAGKSMGGMAAMGAAAFATLGVAAVAAGAAIFTAFTVKSIKSFIAFEDQMTKTAAIMGKTGMDDVPRLTAEVERLGSETRSTAQQVAEAAQILALAGLGEEELVDDKALENLNALAIAAGVDIPTAASISISTIKGMGMEISEMTRVSDVLLNTMTSTFTSIEGLGESMKFLAPTASAAGISLEEAAAAAGVLGNAGLQGSMAGTALRMAITKMIKPTDDARKIMDGLGLNFLSLSPAGQQAQTALIGVNKELERTRIDAERSNSALKALNDELSDLSLDQQRNNLAIMQIRRRAESQGRELNKRELDQIARLEGANEELAITMAERSIAQQEMQRENRALNDSVKEQEKEFSDLNEIVSQQTTGITSLSDVFNQLSASGATTAQILEIFGVRGGTAINAALGQVDAFNALVESNENASEAFDGLGTTQGMVAVMMATTQEQVFRLQSAIAGFMLEVGKQFGPALEEEIIPALIDMTVAMGETIPLFRDIAVMLANELPGIIEEFTPLIVEMMDTFRLMVPIIMLLMKALRLFALFMRPVVEMLSGFSHAILSLMEGDVGGFFEGMADGMKGLFFVLNPLFRIIRAITEFLGFEIPGITNDDDGAMGSTLKGAAVGATIGSIVPGVGTVAGGLIGGAIGFGASFFAEGGIVSGPTAGIVGEAGPEAVIPLDRLGGLVAQGVRQGLDSSKGSGGQVVINGGIHIGSGNNLTVGQVEQMMRQTLPQILRNGMTTGTRSVI